MRSQVVALHNRIRLPHIGVSRAVRYEELYVRPAIQTHPGPLGAPGDRRVILGDPGAGKSTFAAKFAHDTASDELGRVPFLLVLREFTASFDEGGHDLVHYLEKLCQAPYNIKPPQDAVDYLLRSGRAVVVLDGLDEVVRTESRRRVVKLVEGFAHIYPLVPILVTARRIGYYEAPLSNELFTTARIRDFTEDQVRTYVEHWFVLDEATSPAERHRLVTSFMEDSGQIPDLRSNPLLLTLLCAMYSSDRYLPRNLAQVYERCALMLFEQWDAKRGIPLPMKFHGRLRGAVQHLAWTMFTARESGRAQSRSKIMTTLTNYLEGMIDDHDESVATAEQFLEFCTGRAWILTDVGATRFEPQFGFTHRTFLEYFAAEHLVRIHRTAKDLWAAMARNITQWEVVAQIALQLHDRNVAGGVDELLAEALEHGGLDFAVRSLHYMHPSTRTVRAIAVAAVHKSVRVRDRVSIAKRDLSDADDALYTCMYFASAANQQVIEKAVADEIGLLVQAHVVGAAVVLDSFGRPDQPAGTRWADVHRALLAQHREDLTRTLNASPWGAAVLFAEPESLEQLLRRFGPASMYVCGNFHRFSYPSAAKSLIHHNVLPFSDDAAASLADTMTESSTPWAPQTAFNCSDVILNMCDERTDSLRLMLALPYLELFCTYHASNAWAPTYTMLVNGRTDELARPAVLDRLERLPLSARVRAFLSSWVQHEISVTVPDQPSLLPRRLPRRQLRSAAPAGTSPAPATEPSQS
ncbi:NACHT domain-containing protein [Lentzea guizhouensis]